jgi:DNA-binding CsgD family transcriptional regulator
MNEADRSGSRKWRAYMLAILIVANVLCTAFFAMDVITDFESFGSQEAFHLTIEALAAVVLVVGTSFMLLELRRILQRNASMEIGIRAARGEMNSLIDRFFTDWRLSDAERDVALLLLKGLDNDTIASIRGTATGTVRAQCASIYAKAKVDGRSQLMSVFVEELLSEPLSSPRQDAVNRAA